MWVKPKSGIGHWVLVSLVKDRLYFFKNLRCINKFHKFQFHSIFFELNYKSKYFIELNAEPKPFRPSQQIDGIEHKNFQFGRQSDFVGQIQLPNIYQQTGFVGQNVLPSVQQTTFVNPSTSVSSSHQTTFVGQNNSPVPQQLSDFVEQVYSPVSQQSHFVEQIKAPISYQPSFVEQGHQPTVVGENITPNHRLNPLLVPQQTSPVVGHNVRQNEFIDHNENKNYNRHTTSSPISKQIDFLDIDFGESTFHESRQNLGRRKNSTSFRHFDDDDEIDTPSDRIYRGWELDPHEFPWMVKLMVSYVMTS